MKSTKLIIAAVALAVSFASCTKMSHGGKHGNGGKEEKATITSEQTITVKAGETMTIALPTELAHDGYAIITNSKYAASSTIDAATLANYNYTAPTTLPAGIGTDEVVVSNDHHVYPIGHIELPNAVEVCGYPQHYTVNVHIVYVDATGKRIQ
jgi:hypothetical protein